MMMMMIMMMIIIIAMTVITVVSNTNSFRPSYDLPITHSLLQPPGSCGKLNLLFRYKFTCVDRALKYEWFCALAKLRKAVISSVVSLRPSAWTQLVDTTRLAPEGFS
jgi:hypothetical protein